MSQAKINPQIIRWARERLGLSIDETARRVGMKDKPERLSAWERGDELPTFSQARELAQTLRIPLGYLFLSKPPEPVLPVADFRLHPEAGRGKFSPELEDVLNDAFRKQDWLRERRVQEGMTPLLFVGRYTTQTSYLVICEDIRKTLDLPIPTAKDVKSHDEHLRFLVHRAEKASILVLQSGYVGSNTRRSLSIEEFRGFALADSYAPLIFLNAKDSISGRIFTLAHELAHLWTGTSGISNPKIDIEEKDQLEIERLCNRVAAELLVPAQAFRERWQTYTYQELAREFRVSMLVVLIRAFELGLLSAQEFQMLYAEAKREIKAAGEHEKPSTGGDFYRNFQIRNGRLLVNEAVQALREGTLLYKEASILLNASPSTLEKALSNL